MASSPFFRVSLGTKHPYSPGSAHLPGYEPARLNFGVVLAVFFGVTALVGAGTWTKTAGESCFECGVCFREKKPSP